MLPTDLAWRDPRWFRLDRTDLSTPLLLRQEKGLEPLQLPMRKFIVHRHPTKSGLPLRSGLARLAAWAWMFKNFTVRDWQIFVTVYGAALMANSQGGRTSH